MTALAERADARSMRWLEHDVAEDDALPDWAKGGEVLPDGAGRACAEGLVLRTESVGSSVVPWDQLLAIARDKKRAYVLAPRRPPSPPWLEVSHRAADRIEKISDGRVSSRGYRDAPTAPRERMQPEEILRRVIARDDVPGAIEVPFKTPKKFPVVLEVIATVPTGLAAAVYGLVITDSYVFGAIAGGACVTFAAGLVAHQRYRAAKAKTRRVLVMTPDAYVGGLDGGQVRAISWDDIEGFRRGKREGKPALVVVGAHDKVLARVPAVYFDIDLDVLLALAEAYRERARRE
jgi:hypothetical protein